MQHTFYYPKKNITVVFDDIAKTFQVNGGPAVEAQTKEVHPGCLVHRVEGLPLPDVNLVYVDLKITETANFCKDISVTWKEVLY